jgi:glucose/arabinose dehydrogenase
MMTRWLFAVVLVFGIGSRWWLAAPVGAQEGRTVVVGGLNAPRGLAFGPDGALYVAEAGTGGDEQVDWVPPFRFARVGASGSISRIDGGRKTAVATGLQSLALGPAAEAVGPQSLAFVGATLYAVVGQMNALPEGRETRSLLVRIGPGGAVETVADLGRFERESNPDATIADSNPFGLTVGPDGNLYVAEAGGNDLLKVTPAGQIGVAHVWRDNPVPTAVAFGPAGEAYVGFLSGNPFTVGSARVDRVSDGGAAVAVPNLTMVVDLAFGPDGVLYVLEFAAQWSREPPPPRYREQSGRILRVTPTGNQVVVGGLNFPTKMAFGPDGALYVTNNGSFVPPNSGEVLRVTLPGAAVPAPPAARPDAAPAQVPRSLP